MRLLGKEEVLLVAGGRYEADTAIGAGIQAGGSLYVGSKCITDPLTIAWYKANIEQCVDSGLANVDTVAKVVDLALNGDFKGAWDTISEAIGLTSPEGPTSTYGPPDGVTDDSGSDGGDGGDSDGGGSDGGGE